MDDVVRFEIAGTARSDLLPRVAGLLAQLGLVPVAVRMHRSGDDAVLTLLQDGIDAHRAAVLAEKMRAIVSVASVDLTCCVPIIEDMP